MRAPDQDRIDLHEEPTTINGLFESAVNPSTAQAERIDQAREALASIIDFEAFRAAHSSSSLRTMVEADKSPALSASEVAMPDGAEVARAASEIAEEVISYRWSEIVQDAASSTYSGDYRHAA